MFRSLVWLIAMINIVVINLFLFFTGPLAILTSFQPEYQLSAYLVWLVFNALIFLVLFAKADMVGEGAISFIGISFNGTFALTVITGFIMLIADAYVADIFVAPFCIILGITTFGQLMTNAYCLEKRPAPV
ncbi:MAG: hypothetical protein RL538_216 [Candidatus Parcubacteria bacterium]|jgi:hypothetical protein